MEREVERPDVSLRDEHGLVDRLDHLELENRWLKRLIVVSLVGVAASLMGTFGAASRTRELSSGRFVLRDDRGRERASLAISEDGQPRLTMLDDRGRDRVSLGIEHDRASALKFRNRERLQMNLTASAGGFSGLELYGGSSNVEAGMYLQPDGEAGVVMHREAGGLLMGVDSEGRPRIGESTALVSPIPAPGGLAVDAFEVGPVPESRAVEVDGPPPRPIAKTLPAERSQGEGGGLGGPAASTRTLLAP